MATRHIRRLQEQLKQTDADNEQQSEETETDEEADGPAPFNPFDLLTDDDAPAPDDDEDVDNESDEADVTQQQQQQQQQQQTQTQPAQDQMPAAVKSNGSGSSKKKSKQKGKGKQAAAGDITPAKPSSTSKISKTDTTAGSQQQSQEEDIDKLLQELNIVPTAAGSNGSRSLTATSSSRSGLPPLLGVDPKSIRGDAELRRMFGAGVVEAVDRMDGAAAARRFGGAAASGRAAVRRRQLKKCLLVTPAEHWPHVDSGISMKQIGTGPDGTPRFCYSWSPNYSAAQRVFEQAQASYDPNAVAAVLHQFPYHVDSLLAMNELYRSLGEAQTADDLLARALYALEAAWPSAFNPVTAAVRLDIEKPENKGLFLALFRHAQALSRRGCHSSALEVTKLLLALDPEDPLGGLLLLDYLALRAGAYTYLERFVSEFDSSHSLALLPNYAFSLPMARFRLEQQQQRQQKQQAPSSSSSSSSGVSSHTLLAQALLLYPVVLRELMSKLQSQGVGKDSSWTALMARKLFAKADDHGSESLSHLISLFVERSHQLWKAADVQAWLKTAAEAAADVADGKHINPAAAAAAGLSSSAVKPDDIVVEGSADDWACVARETFPASGRNEYGHLRLSDFSDTVNALPQEEMQAALAAAAGRGPAAQGQDMDAAMDVLNDMLAQQQIAAAEGRAAPAVSDEEMRTANPLLMLLQSMLPWVNAGQQPDYAAAEGQQQQQQGQQQPPGSGDDSNAGQ